MADLPLQRILDHVVDVHCHPTDAPYISTEEMSRLPITICAMSSKPSDQQLVHDLALAHPTKVVPCFGYHPWFTYQISIRPHSNLSKSEHYRNLFLQSTSPSVDHLNLLDQLLPSLPLPIPLSDILLELRRNLEAFPTAMLGEVGLDRAFRIPYDFNEQPRRLTPLTVPFEHQLNILEAQIDLAVDLGRNISLHSVKSQLATVDLLARMKAKHASEWDRINIDLHSCGVSPETWLDIERKHRNVFLSLSTVINGRSPNHKALIMACSSDRILAESDYNDVAHCTERTWEMIKIIAATKGWPLETEWSEILEKQDRRGAVQILEENWLKFKGKLREAGK